MCTRLFSCFVDLPHKRGLKCASNQVEVVSMIEERLGHYRILEKIGAGGMGEVYRARDERLEREVAVKVLPHGMLSDDSVRKRLRKEAQILSKLSHPNIEILFDFDNQDLVEFLVVEYVAGVTLSEVLSNGALPEKEVARIGVQ